MMSTAKLSSADGAVFVVVAVALSAIILIVALVLSTGSWFERNRHLQLQADAGALAGASSFNACVSATSAERTNPGSGVNTTIRNLAKQYAGDPAATSPLNKQVASNPNADVAVFVNSDGYGSAGADDTETDPAPGGPPCKSGYVDVKVTDSNLPWLFHVGPFGKANTHARVSMLQISTLAGSLPLAVEDVNPLAAGAIFVNEDAGNAILARTPLTVGGATTLNGMNLNPWTSGAVSVNVSTAHTGVVIALCSNKNLCKDPAITTWLNGPLTVNAICSQALINCYQDNGTGLELIRGYTNSGTGSASAPIVRDVSLTTGNCTDDSSPYFLLNGGCSVGAQADVDFGLTGDPSRPPSGGGLSAQVSVGSCGLSYVSSTGTTSHWSANSCQTVGSGAGAVPLNLTWQTGSGKTKVTGTVTRVARPYANNGPTDDQSYPIAYAQLQKGATCVSGSANSVPFGTTSFCVGIGVIGNLKNASDVSDPTKVLKFIGGSHTGAIQCNGKTGADALADAIRVGCSTPVQLNPGELCPNTTDPVDCLPLETGGKVGPTRAAMNDRFAPSDVCPPNNWVASPGTLPNIPNGDRRVVPLIVTLYGSFSGSGGGYVPVTDFGVFYVTGWDGAPASCAGINESAPAGAGNGSIWGHFIKYVGDLSTSTGGVACDFSAFSPCITVMTR